MKPIGFEAEEWLRRLQDVLTQIRDAIDEGRRYLRDLDQTLGGVRRTLGDLEGRLSTDGLCDLIQQMDELQNDFRKMESFLSPGMLNDLRLRLERSRDELSQAAERIAEARQRSKTLREALEQRVEEQSDLHELANALKQGDDTLTVLIRNLSHLQESLPALDADTAVQVFANLLQGSLRLAALIFDPRQLQGISVGLSERPTRILDLLRKRWGDWLRELAQYIQEVSRHAEQIAALEGGTQAEAFRTALEDFRSACREAAASETSTLPPSLPESMPPVPPTSAPWTPEGESP